MANITQTCTVCSKQFLVIDKEQQFLQEKSLPLPTNCPTCRQTRRLKLRGERALYRAKCSKCDKEIIVSYDPKTVTNQILCKHDYEQYFLENDPIITDPLPDA
ncbi:MAG: zinc-ribbon domain containing protein [Candidatus Levybacteria bacterium]|nr:zinc-ribbon domain containing protein [Candidatus Levybacteria bacterium]